MQSLKYKETTTTTNPTDHTMNKSSENAPKHNKGKTKCANNVSNYFKQYCQSTSIHGFKYFGENRSVFEKVWWATIFAICLPFCSYMIYKIYEKYDTSPVIVSFSTKETPVHQIPFPAVTICPETKAVKSKFNFTRIIQKKIKNQTLTPEENKYLQYTSILCEADDDVADILQLEMTNTTLDPTSLLEALEEIRPTIYGEPLILDCKFLVNDMDCVDEFTRVITDEGICYSFNIMDRSELFSDLVSPYKDYHDMGDKWVGQWSPETGYTEPTDLNVHPTRVFAAGASQGLILELGTMIEDLDYLCKPIQGFKVVLHSPFRVPKLKQEYFRVPLDQAVIAAVQPSMITTSDKVKAFDVTKRECYFTTEKKLKYFKFYSQQNCQLECITNITLDLCGCVQIHMPRENFTKICGPAKQECIKDAQERAVAADLDVFKRDIQEVVGLDDVEFCKCLPLCTDIRYDSETSQAEWKWDEKFRLLGLTEFTKEKMHLSRLTVYFKFNHFITSERQELYGPTDFVANFGGLLGLFTGFSILSLMEIIYFLTVRICCNIRLYGRWIGEAQ